VVWLDVLDLPVVYYAETSYAIEGKRQAVKPGHGDQAYARGGVLPTPLFQRDSERSSRDGYPMLRYPWADAKAALQAMAADRPELEAVQVTYVNPETGVDAQNNLGFYALMLRPGQTLKLPARSPSCVFHQIEGCADVAVEGATPFKLAEADTCCAPGYTAVTLTNRSASAPAFVFMADESPFHRKLGVYEVR
jgi:gentisate 1,2-dioxygenase